MMEACFQDCCGDASFHCLEASCKNCGEVKKDKKWRIKKLLKGNKNKREKSKKNKNSVLCKGARFEKINNNTFLTLCIVSCNIPIYACVCVSHFATASFR